MKETELSMVRRIVLQNDHTAFVEAIDLNNNDKVIVVSCKFGSAPLRYKDNEKFNILKVIIDEREHLLFEDNSEVRWHNYSPLFGYTQHELNCFETKTVKENSDFFEWNFDAAIYNRDKNTERYKKEKESQEKNNRMIEDFKNGKNFDCLKMTKEEQELKRLELKVCDGIKKISKAIKN